MKKRFLVLALSLFVYSASFASTVDIVRDFFHYPGLNIEGSGGYNFEKGLPLSGRTSLGVATNIAQFYKLVDLKLALQAYANEDDFVIAPMVPLQKLLGSDITSTLSGFVFDSVSIGVGASPDNYNDLQGHWSVLLLSTWFNQDLDLGKIFHNVLSGGDTK